jgi:hypothetical protein
LPLLVWSDGGSFRINDKPGNKNERFPALVFFEAVTRAGTFLVGADENA